MSIYDYYVERMLVEYNKRDHFTELKKEDFRHYPKFIAIMNAFRKFYGLEQFSLRNMDVFLWQAGKEYFPKKYHKAKATKPINVDEEVL